MRRILYLRRLLYTLKNCEHSEPNGLSAAYTFVTLLQLRFSGWANYDASGLVYCNILGEGGLLFSPAIDLAIPSKKGKKGVLRVFTNSNPSCSSVTSSFPHLQFIVRYQIGTHFFNLIPNRYPYTIYTEIFLYIICY